LLEGVQYTHINYPDGHLNLATTKPVRITKIMLNDVIFPNLINRLLFKRGTLFTCQSQGSAASPACQVPYGQHDGIFFLRLLVTMAGNASVRGLIHLHALSG